MKTGVDDLKLAYFRSLPKRQFESFCRKLSFDPQKPNVYQKLAKAKGAVTLSLGHESYSMDELRTMASAVGADASASSAIAVANSIAARFREAVRVQMLGERIVEFDEFMAAVKPLAKRVQLLRSRPAPEARAEPVGFFNPNAAFGTDWIIVDIHAHPNPRVRRDCTLLVTSTGYEGGRVDVSEAALSRPSPDWSPLYPHEVVEYPTLEFLESLEDLPFAIPDDVELRGLYGAEVQGTAFVSAFHHFFAATPMPYDDVYAQMDGFLNTWPDESVEEQFGRQLVLRTYANSEPWTETFLLNDGAYLVRHRIT